MDDVFLHAMHTILSDDVEGGYTNDPDDPGGETKWGLSKRQYPNLDIAALTRDEAVALYDRDYWEKYKLYRLPPMLAVAALDGAVNQGPRPAIKLLQRALGATPDGDIGPETVRAAYRAEQHYALQRYFARRATRYAATPGWARYGGGWMARLFVVHRCCLDLCR